MLDVLLVALLATSPAAQSSESPAPARTCTGTINPKLGTYELVLYCPPGPRWITKTYLDGPLAGMVVRNGESAAVSYKEVITRVAPNASTNYIPDGWAVTMTVEPCYYAIFDQLRFNINPVNGLLQPYHWVEDFCDE